MSKTWKLNSKNLKSPKCFEYCKDVHCDSVEHKLACDEAIENVLITVENSAKDCIPKSGKCSDMNKKKEEQ